MTPAPGSPEIFGSVLLALSWPSASGFMLGACSIMAVEIVLAIYHGRRKAKQAQAQPKKIDLPTEFGVDGQPAELAYDGRLPDVKWVLRQAWAFQGLVRLVRDLDALERGEGPLSDGRDVWLTGLEQQINDVFDRERGNKPPGYVWRDADVRRLFEAIVLRAVEDLQLREDVALMDDGSGR